MIRYQLGLRPASDWYVPTTVACRVSGLASIFIEIRGDGERLPTVGCHLSARTPAGQAYSSLGHCSPSMAIVPLRATDRTTEAMHNGIKVPRATPPFCQ